MIKSNLEKNALSYLSFLFSLFYNLLYPQKRELGIPVLYYHKVLPKMPKYKKSSAVLLKNFDKQMQYLKREGYATISLEDLYKWLNNKKELPENPILLTFDDGHYSVYKYAYPILEKHGMKATIFLSSNFINGKDSEVVQTLCSPAIKNNSDALEYIKHNPDSCLPLSWNNVHFLKNRGYSFGSHTMNHVNLSNLSDLQLAEELKSSKKKIELKINKNVFALSYPYGEYDCKVINFLKNKTNYKMAFTSQYGFVTKNMNKLELKRVNIRDDDSLVVFRAKLNGFDFRTFIKNILKIKKFHRHSD
jgi:peptidoglycan/xylan/chitin deacetylase (PgdA/CDA1 family)